MKDEDKVDMPTMDDLCDVGVKPMPIYEPDKIDDNTIMYFGKYKGTRLKDIPDRYFSGLFMMADHWLKKTYPKMYKYIKLVADNYEPEEVEWCNFCCRPEYACKC